LTAYQVCYNYNGWKVATTVNANYVHYSGRFRIALETISSGNKGYFLEEGMIRNDAWSVNVTVGRKIYAIAAGAISGTRPTAANSTVVEIGYSIGNNQIVLLPNPVIGRGWRSQDGYAGGTLTPTASYAPRIKINVDDTALEIGAPDISMVDDEITYLIYNNYNGAHGAVTWNAVYKMQGAFPAAGIAYQKSRSITFWYDGTNWWEKSRVDVDM